MPPQPLTTAQLKRMTKAQLIEVIDGLVEHTTHAAPAPAPSPAPVAKAPAESLVLPTAGGCLVVAGVDALDDKWTHNSRATRGYAVDVWGEGAESIARRMVPNKRDDDGIVCLADGTWRVKCTDARQAQLVYDSARRHIITTEQVGKSFASPRRLAASAVQATDAVRGDGTGLVPVLPAFALRADGVRVAVYRDDDTDAVTCVELTPL